MVIVPGPRLGRTLVKCIIGTRFGHDKCMRAAPIAVLAAVLLAGCGTSQLKQNATEQTIVRFVVRHTGFRPTDVTCPTGVEAVVATTFDCNFTGPDGLYVAHMRVNSVQGTRVIFEIRTRRLANAGPVAEFPTWLTITGFRPA
jgi:Domain of unknown function (DUF4333)